MEPYDSHVNHNVIFHVPSLFFWIHGIICIICLQIHGCWIMYNCISKLLAFFFVSGQQICRRLYRRHTKFPVLPLAYINLAVGIHTSMCRRRHTRNCHVSMFADGQAVGKYVNAVRCSRMLLFVADGCSCRRSNKTVGTWCVCRRPLYADGFSWVCRQARRRQPPRSICWRWPSA